ncbi:expressed unknown protein [Seminavis robusta]|uniref:Uncharacterized protein n=1 Tax=Seminavis robusta TaxID=568900 RepID=A0A9N8DFT4_9STRA|nr:expressed unknown protein [Seminavis robusta]|eukprot:Sro104_g052790.1 n/a (441) ;mRNA; f:46292-47700
MNGHQYPHSPKPAYQFERSPGGGGENLLQGSPSHAESLDYSSNIDSESYTALGGAASLTGLVPNYPSYQDATETVREMYLALLYLLSNPEEFHRALQVHPAYGATTLTEWNAEYDTESITDGGSIVTTAESAVSLSGPTPLPFVVFSDDAEVVLPQAHTASQLFGLERIEGIELEAAAGIHSLSQLFLRWLALMPGGDHLNMIDPPGLTVMRIAGGRYRVTAAHRVVWTWMNEFAALAEAHGNDAVETLQAGDLVTMTIVDVFETDSQGKLLSYCPTFDNRAVKKTNPATETFRKSSSKLFTILNKVQNSKTAKGFYSRAKSVASTVKHRMDEAAANYTSSPRRRPPNSDVGSSVAEFEQALNAAETAALGPRPNSEDNNGSGSDTTLQDAEPTGKEHDKTRRQQGFEPEPNQLTEQRQTTNTRSEAYFSDDDDMPENVI